MADCCCLSMPRHDYHNSVSKSPKSPMIHKMLDLPGAMTHWDWRKKTHDPLTAYTIGYCIDGHRGGLDALRHILDDMVLNKINKYL